MSEKIDYSQGIYDAKALGTPMGAQHMFAMFGATVLVPLLTGLSVSTTLLCAGLGTLLFHLITKRKVPAFLGSSFAYLGGHPSCWMRTAKLPSQTRKCCLTPALRLHSPVWSTFWFLS